MLVYNKNGQSINLDTNKEISRGGEGMILEAPNNMVAKIYLPGIPPMTEAKFNSLQKLQSSEFVRPEILLFDKQKKEVGYMMRMIDQTHYPFFSAMNVNFCNRHNIDIKYKVKLAEKIIKSTDFVHKQNIVIGDLNPLNILIDDLGDLQFIDVDSYETPGFPHSGRLLDDIRDHLRNGKIDKESDYFALSVLIFNFLTNLHPFKGIHTQHKTLAEREIYKIPVIKNDPKLKLPKCYEPLQDKYLLDQFSKIFINGDRFLLSMNKNTQILMPRVKAVVVQNELMIAEILKNTKIKYIISSENFICIYTDTQIIVYDVSSKGHFRELYRLSNSFDIYPTNNKILFKDGKYLYVRKNAETLRIDNFVFPPTTLHIQQYGNILVVIDEDMMYKLYLDDVMQVRDKYQIRVENVSVFGKGFRNYDGLVQNINGNSYIFYNSSGVLNTLKFPVRVDNIYQIGDVGIAQYYENNKIQFNQFKINGLSIYLDKTNLNSLRYFGYKKDGFVVLPEDDNLVMQRNLDFSELARFDTGLVNESSEVHLTNAGIVLSDGNNVYLINKKF